MAILEALISLGANMLFFIFRVFAAIVVAFIMSVKGRKGWFWGILTLIFPFIIFFIFLIPAKEAKLNPEIRKHPAFSGLNPVIASIMALSAIVAKADGRISQDEVKLIRSFVRKRYGISSEELDHYKSAFNYGKSHPDHYEYFTTMLRQSRRYDTVRAVSYLLVGMVAVEGTMAPEMDNLLRTITTSMGLSVYEYLSIIRHYTMSQGGYTQGSGFDQRYGGSQGYNAYSGGLSQKEQIKKYSEVLKVPEDADLKTIKKAYRKLAKEYHPDKMAGEGMPEDYMAFANGRISEINEAYEYLKKVKEVA